MDATPKTIAAWKPDGLTTSAAAVERIALIGLPGSGKTTSCLSFPAPRLWLDFDHQVPAGEEIIPFWNPTFCDSQAARTFKTHPPNQRDAIRNWLKKNAKDIPPNYTIILDTLSAMTRGFNLQENLENDMVADESKSGFTFWKNKLRFFEETIHYLKGVSCRVVVLMHEARKTDHAGVDTGKIRPVIDGSYKDQIIGDFPDVWRMLRNPAIKDEKGQRVVKDGKVACQPGLFWQIAGSDTMNCKTNPSLTPAVIGRGITMVNADPRTNGGYPEILKLYGTAGN